jgi:predicted phosphate transport protein (TIGR00153 family)
MLKLTPTNPKFYDFFDQLTDVLVQAARQFLHGLDHFDNPRRLAEEIKRLEHQGDNLAHDTMGLLHQSFITPLERSDIRRLTMAIDDVLDFIEDAAQHIALYEIDTILPPVREMAQVLLDASQVVRLAVHEIRNLNRRNGIMEHCIEIHRLEDEGDRIQHEVLAWLFKSGMDPLSVIKWKEIIDDIETAIDRCQDVSNVVEGIVLENV